ncbi:Origin recognition complex, subunit 1 [Rhizoclosmatium sp. JEL0117]|nr:Origin recognition complex, subunit 1 [Rhizoclosmatium sp. JEL0117]
MTLTPSKRPHTNPLSEGRPQRTPKTPRVTVLSQRRIEETESSDDSDDSEFNSDETSSSGDDDDAIDDKENDDDSSDADLDNDSDNGKPQRSTRRKTAKLAKLPKNKHLISAAKRDHILQLLPKRVVSSTHSAAASLTDEDPLARVRELLHVSHVPEVLPCRDAQFEEVYTYLVSAVEKGGGECIYISGVPGTGKTATVRQVIKTLQSQISDGSIPEFKYVEINGMKLTDPNQAYCAIYEGLFPGTPKVSAKHACDLLQEVFRKPSTDAVPIILMVDELDLLLTSKQTVIYNLFNWPRLPSSPLILITIANTMDLPERVFSHKINSRVGGTRLGFHAYTANDLAVIIGSRVGVPGGAVLSDDAITFVAKKVAGMSGDARRALDICRKGIESLQQIIAKNDASLLAPYISAKDGKPHVTTKLIQSVIRDLFSPTVVPFISNLSLHQKLFLLAIRKYMRKTGTTDAAFVDVVDEHKALCAVVGDTGITPPNTWLCQKLALQLFAGRLILMEVGKGVSAGDPMQRCKLNVSEGDLVLGLRDDKVLERLMKREV